MPTKYDTDFFVGEASPHTVPSTEGSEGNRYDSDFFIPEAEGAAPPLSSHSLSPEQTAAIAGGAAGVVFGRHAAPSGEGVIARTAERLAGAPQGSLAAVQDLTAPSSLAAASRRVAEQHVAPAVVPPLPASPVATPAELAVTPGGKWGAKTGYGIGEGSTADTAERYRRSAGQGKVVSQLEKKFGVPRPGESPHVVERMLARSAAAEAAKAEQEAALARAIEQDRAQARALEEAANAKRSTLEKMAKNIHTAGSISGTAQHALRAGLNIGAGIFGGVHGFNALSDMQQQGFTPENVLQAGEGGGALYAMRNPSFGLPVAGGAAVVGAGRDMAANGITADNAAKMASGAGLVAMPRWPAVGLALQAPSLAMTALDYIKAHPEVLALWRTQARP